MTQKRSFLITATITTGREYAWNVKWKTGQDVVDVVAGKGQGSAKIIISGSDNYSISGH